MKPASATSNSKKTTIDSLEPMVLMSASAIDGEDAAAIETQIGTDGRDVLVGGIGNDLLDGGGGRDALFGSLGDDVLLGGSGSDTLRGDAGNDVLVGGTGRDNLDGGFGDDVFVYNQGDGSDQIRNFNLLGNDVAVINVDGINNLDDLLATSSVRSFGTSQLVTFSFGDGDQLRLFTDNIDNFSESDFVFNSADSIADGLARVASNASGEVDVSATPSESEDVNASTVFVTVQQGADGAVDVNVDGDVSETGDASLEIRTGDEVVPPQPGEVPQNTLRDGAVFVTARQGADGEVDVNVNGDLAEAGNATFEVRSGDEVVATQQDQPQPSAPSNPGVELVGTDGRDRLSGGNGDDVISGGKGRDVLDGGFGDDTFIYNEGDGRDRIRNFDLLGDDRIILNVDGINSLSDLLATSRVRTFGDNDFVTFEFGGGDRLQLLTSSFESLTDEDFIFNGQVS